MNVELAHPGRYPTTCKRPQLNPSTQCGDMLRTDAQTDMLRKPTVPHHRAPLSRTTPLRGVVDVALRATSPLSFAEHAPLTLVN